jgi:hypothetical protein
MRYSEDRPGTCAKLVNVFFRFAVALGSVHNAINAPDVNQHVMVAGTNLSAALGGRPAEILQQLRRLGNASVTAVCHAFSLSIL